MLKKFTMQRLKPYAYVISCAMILTMLGACASNIHGNFCELYQPVYTHSQDTENTKSQVDQNNAIWEALCL